MSEELKLLIGKGEQQVHLLAKLANRHGLIAGATGTGKTVTLQVLAESFSRIGVPVFMADVKGDLSGISQAGSPHPKVDERIKKIGINDFEFSDNPAVFWDLRGDKGHPIRATVSDMGPNLLARLMQLNETQEGILSIAFRFADDEGMLMLDLKDLQSTLKFLAENAKEFREEYGNITSASVGAIQRRLLVLEEDGADEFFGEPSLELWDLIRTAHTGKGLINILNAQNLVMNPKLYATFLLWLLSELFEELPEVGDQDKPRFVFFFDEAHLLFKDAPKALEEKVETVVKLIRSKGVGIYFITQSPSDIPDGVLGQLGNRIQHALRAFTPKDQKAVRVVAQTMRANPAIDTKEVIGQLGVGEALVSVLDADGVPTMVDRVLVRPPTSRIGPATEAELGVVKSNSPHSGRYDTPVDRESAYELLKARVIKQTQAAQSKIEAEEAVKAAKKEEKARLKAEGKPRGRGRQTLAEAATKTFVRSISSRLATQVVRGILGGFMRR